VVVEVEAVVDSESPFGEDVRALAVVEPATERTLALDKCVFTPSSLTIDSSTTFEEWDNLGEFLSRAEKSVHWWIGDWINFGEAAYGEKYAQALDETRFTYGTLRNDAWVARKIPPERRRAGVSFSHHTVVAKLEPAKQTEYLEECERRRWSKNQLRVLVTENEAEHRDPTQRQFNAPEQHDVVLVWPQWRYYNPLDPTIPDLRSLFFQGQDLMNLYNGSPELQGSIGPNAFLFIQAPTACVDQACLMIVAWGFGFRGSFAVPSEPPLTTVYCTHRHEVFVFGKRGHQLGHLPRHRPSTLLAPGESIYDAIEMMFPPARQHRYLHIWPPRQHQGRDGWDELPLAPTSKNY
jgi:hypothetical protein